MKITTEKLKELLVAPGHVSEKDFGSAEKEAKAQKKPLAEVLVDKDLIKDEQLGRLIAEEVGFKFVDLRTVKIDEEVLDLIPELVARSKGVIAFARTDEGVKVGMTDPNDLEIKHLIEKRVGQKVLPFYITRRGLEGALAGYEAGLKEEFEEILKRLKDKSLSREERDEATVKMVDTLLMYAYQNKASDIHVEPYNKKVVVRFRIDGIMHDVLSIPKDLMEFILSRVKILSKMRTDEHRAAQDGKLRFWAGTNLEATSPSGGNVSKSAEGETVDVRVSVVPVTEGENIVMRLLSAKGRQFGLKDLGLEEQDLKRVSRAIKKPHGMILVTGPTGSGKTTTLYGVMKILNKREVNIATIEDPVEYDIEGVSQIQVNPKTNLTFAKGLRAIVRQDPDIIMVCEIRDEETAGIAVNSALTGHLVLSTLHTNDAATTLPRLLDMGIEPFLVASTVNVAIAQRLVRKICEKCRASASLSDEEKQILEHEPHVLEILSAKKFGGDASKSDDSEATPPSKLDLSKVRIYKGHGCKVCGNTGYTGRVGVFEVLEMADNIKELILKHASSDEIMAVARANGMTTMMEDGIGKVLSGVTTLQEVLRVTKE